MRGQATLLDCCKYESFRVVRGDCRDEALMKPLIAKADAIIPLAALVAAVALYVWWHLGQPGRRRGDSGAAAGP